MGRGLSGEQRALLGLACAVNRETQGGTLAVKPGKPVDGYKIPTIDYAGPRDLRLPLAVWATGGFVPDRRSIVNLNTTYHSTPRYESAKSSLSRAITRLVKRGLLVYAPWIEIVRDGYLLTEAGIEAGAEHERYPVMLDVALRAFEMVRPAGWSYKPLHKYDNPKSNEAWHQGQARSEALKTLCYGSPNGYRPLETNDHQPIDVTVNEVPSRDRVNRYGDNEVLDVEPVDALDSRDFVNR